MQTGSISVGHNERYHLGTGWRQDPSRLVAGRGREPLPWAEEYAERVFNGEFPVTASGFDQLVVLKGSLDAPEAVASFQNEGHTVKVEFFDDQLRTELTYLFADARLGPDDTFLHDDGVQRPGDLLLRDVTCIRWTGERGISGETFNADTRQYSNLGTTRVLRHPFPGIVRGPEVEWHVDPEVDVSGDGFWEPVATFGDWDRWFVRDRPGVKLVD